MYEGPTEDRLGELGSLFKNYYYYYYYSVSPNITNNKNIFYLNTVGFKANTAYGALVKMLTK